MILKFLVPFLFLSTFCLVSPAHEIEEFFIQSGEIQLFCRKMGSGKPLVILHGGPGMTQDYLLPQMSQLAENSLIIFYDQRGCGQSYSPINEQSINMETYVEDLDQIRRELQVDKISILGHNWGGFLAMHYAIAHPKAVDKLILSNSMPASSEDMALFNAEWLHRISLYA